MRITEADFAVLRPVSSYGEACYPAVRPAAGEPDPWTADSWMNRSWIGVIARHGKKGLAAAAILASTCACQGAVRVPFPIDEALGIQIIVERFQAEGVTFEQDYHYSSGAVEFDADGFNASLGIGFEYDSQLDNDYGAEAEKYLSWDERADLEDAMATGGDAIGYFDSSQIHFDTGYSEDVEVARAALEAQVDEFIEFLRSSGRL